ncbi:hypothetical protein BDZ89DRAFT_1145312 [Hymenopellis radicata]|nr:hypothetical protein BDZ89DRAFT_1145312 [Hymenopellis radicata]
MANGDYQAQKLFNLDGLVAVVTGGGTGIGYMIAKGLAENGAKVYITGRRKDVLEKVVSSGAVKGTVIPLQMDVTSKESIMEVKKVLQEKEGKLHILVNNAGQVGPCSFWFNDLTSPQHKDAETVGQALFEESAQGWADVYAINVHSIYFVTTAFLGLLEAGTKSRPGYTSTHRNISRTTVRKAAASALTKMLSTELALKKIPVRVNAVAPGVYESEMSQLVISPEETDLTGKGVLPVPARRPGTGEEMAATVVYIASQSGCYMNGQEIVIDGGYTAQRQCNKQRGKLNNWCTVCFADNSHRTHINMAANSSRRPMPPSSDYTAVSQQSPRMSGSQYNPARPPQRSTSAASVHVQQGRSSVAQGVASGAIGGAYGPYSYNPQQSKDMYNASRFSAAPSELSSITGADKTAFANSSTVPQYLWDKDPDLDDALHNPDPVRDAKLDRSFTLFSGRGWANASALVILVTGLITLFAGYPIIDYYARQRPQSSGFNLGGINGSGQVPDLPGLPSLIDADTPTSAYSRTGLDGKKYNLVFSDEFELDGRTFYPGEDPYWEAADIHYWPTGDLEWYDPSALTTKDGKLVITLSMEDIHDLNWKSGMLTSWNKLCFTTGYIEVSVSMPGRADAPGLWPGAWTMGNLGRAGYGATTEGMWPYSYDSCDTGPFQIRPLHRESQRRHLLDPIVGVKLAFFQVSDCQHALALEVIILALPPALGVGEVSQSYQVAPFNYQYQFDNTSSTMYDDTLTHYNTYKGGQYQQAVSAVTLIPTNLYNDQGYGAYGFEWYSNPDSRDEGFIEWVSDGVASWKITSATVGSDSTVEIGPRLISEEPMYIILNLGLSPSFQQQDYMHLEFPSKMYIDYVRVYQRAGTKNGLTCNPPNRPTSTYINDHINAYSNANFTVWDAAGYEFPRNSLYDGC